MKFQFEVTILLLTLQLGALAQNPRQDPPPSAPQQKDAAPPQAAGDPAQQDPSKPPTWQETRPQTPPGTDLKVPQDLSNPEQVLENSPLMSEQSKPLPPLPDLRRLGVGATDLLKLSLYDAVRLALENNNDIEVSRDTVRINETTLKSLQGVYDPIFSISPQIIRSVIPTTSSLEGSGSGAISDTDFLLTPTFTKQFSTGGGNYQFFFNNLRRTTNSTINILSPFYSSSLGVTFTQPLLRNRAIDQFRHDIRVQRKKLSQSDLDFRLQTIAVISQVQQAYWELIFALKDQQNQFDSLLLARDQLQMIEYRIQHGLSAPLERAEAETQIATAETNLLASTNYVTVTENNLKQVILRNPKSPEWGRQIRPTDQPVIKTIHLNLPELLNEARANRPELRRIDLQQDISHLDVQLFKNQTLPQVDIQTTASTLGLAGTVEKVPLISGNPGSNSTAFLLDQINQLRVAQGLPPVNSTANRTAPPNLTGGYGKMLRNLTNFNTYNVLTGLTIQLPLHNTTAKANLAGALIESEQTFAARQSQEQIIENDVRTSAQTVETTRQQVISSRAARQSAEVQLAGERKLYQTGLSTTFLVFQRENQLVTARTAEVRAETDYTKAVANLQRAISTTLRENHVTIDTPRP